MKVERQVFERQLVDFGVDFEIWQKLDLVYIAKEADSSLLMSLPGYTEGWFYIQNLSSIMAVLAVNPLPDEKILDIAAAPGGKTALMAVLMNNTGEILANDLSKERIFKMKQTFKRLGVVNVRIMNKPGEMVWRLYPNYFDKVLADVPCSMDDRVEVTAKRIASLVPRQKRLIWSAFTCTKLGGRLVYSTCTSTKEENEEVVAGLLSSEPNLAKELLSERIVKDETMGTFFYSVIEKS